MSQGCDGLFWFNNLLIWAFLGTSAHESVPPVGYLLATCWLPAGLSLWVAGQKSNENPRVKRRSALHGRIWAPLEPSWNQLEPTCGQLGVCLTQLSINLVEIDAILGQIDAILGTENIENHWFSFVFQAFLLCRHSYNIEAMLDEVGRNYEPFRVNFGSVGAVLGPTLPIFGPTWAHLQPSWDGSELYWIHLGAN